MQPTMPSTIEAQLSDMKLSTLKAMCHDLGLLVGADRAQIEATIGEAIARAAKASGIKSGMAPRKLLDQLKPTTLYFICEDWKVELTHLESGDYKSLARQLVTHRIQHACFTRPFLDEAASSSHPSPSQASSRGFTLEPAPPFGPPDYTPSCSYAASNSRASVAPWSAASCASSWECPRDPDSGSFCSGYGPAPPFPSWMKNDG